MTKEYVLVSFDCPKCSKEVVETTSVLVGDAVVRCKSCAAVFPVHIKQTESDRLASIAESPQVSVSVCHVQLEDDDEDDDEWLAYDPPEDPYSIFNDAYHRLGDIIGEYGEGRGSTLPHSAYVINRMVFASAIGAMEAFLGDMLIRNAMSEEVVLKRLLTGEHELKDMSVRLQDAHENPNIVKDKVRKHLAEILYHNLSKVSALYQVAFKVKIFADAELRARLQRAVVTRHDIVHRNGKTQDGELVTIETSDVFALLEDIKVFVNHTYTSVTNAVVLMGFEDLSLSSGNQ
jgi:transcription elongation factor Elf1